MAKEVVLDTCIFVEAWTEESLSVECGKIIRQYMNDKRRGTYIPIIVPGETIKEILRQIDDKDRIISILSKYSKCFLNKNVNFIDIDKNVLEIKKKLDHIRVDEHDKLIIACAISSEVKEIITLDNVWSAEEEEIRKVSHDVKGYKIGIRNLRGPKSFLKKLKRK